MSDEFTKPLPVKKNKISRYFKGNKKIKERVNNIFKLETEICDLKTSIILTSNKYESLGISNNKEEAWVNKFPLSSFREFCEADLGRPPSYNLLNLKERSLLKKEIALRVDELNKKDNDVYFENLDLLQEKIQHIIDKISKLD